LLYLIGQSGTDRVIHISYIYKATKQGWLHTWFRGVPMYSMYSHKEESTAHTIYRLYRNPPLTRPFRCDPHIHPGRMVTFLVAVLQSQGHLPAKDGSTWPMVFLGCMLFLPGYYHGRIAYYAARGVPGYHFDAIPAF
jgi:hypothetical protein